MLTAIRLISFALVCFLQGVSASYVATVVPGSETIQAPAVERRIHINPPGTNDSRYVYIPFDVPPHTVRISISYQYDRADGANTIDIGLFDARSTSSDIDPNGFRGWSGGRRSEFFVSRDEATPGYMPGEIPQGTWRIILGLYRVVPAGVDVSFKIGIETDGNESSSPTPAQGHRKLSAPAPGTNARNKLGPTDPESRVAGQSPHWWSGDLHMHTVHSDGDWTIAELISSARKSGLDFICITDHNTASHHSEMDRAVGSQQPLVLRGEEITTYGGHTNAWGLPSGTWIDFRVRPGDTARIASIATQVHQSGALISINHPFALCGGCGWSYDIAAHGFDAIEVWNGAWDQTDDQALAMWDKILQTGRRITAVASSDSHRAINPIGQPTTHVAANVLSQTALLEAIRRGHVYLTGEIAKPVVRFEAQAMAKRGSPLTIGDQAHLKAPDTMRFLITTEAIPADATISLIANGQVVRSFPAKPGRQPQVVEIECRRNSYFRLEIRDGTKRMLALTNPIYVKVG